MKRSRSHSSDSPAPGHRPRPRGEALPLDLSVACAWVDLGEAGAPERELIKPTPRVGEDAGEGDEGLVIPSAPMPGHTSSYEAC